MPINAHPEYITAEKEYHEAEGIEEKIEKLKKMISFVPGHKGAENLRAQLKTRLRKLQEQLNKQKKSGKSSRIGIKKEDMQAVILGKANSGKSSIMKILTNAKVEVAQYKFTTNIPTIGMMNYKNVGIQLIENPAIESENYDKGLANTADTVLILITNLEELKEIEKLLKKSFGKRIIIFNKIDKLTQNEQRKISATLASRKYNFSLISAKTKQGIPELKEKIFQSFDKLRIYTKQPEEKQKSKKPMILNPNSIVKDVAEKILKGFSSRVKETRIWGPSSKYPGQVVGMNHKLKDMDVVEFKTK